MFRFNTEKKGRLRSGIIAALAAAAAVCTVAAGKPMEARAAEDSYRFIQIYQLDGKADVTRKGSSMTPYANMALISGDAVSTHEASYLYMKVDSDKYIMAEPLTDFSIEATGNQKKSSTKINLSKGAVVNRVDEKLSADSAYEVNTPNSTIAIRGTEFRVEVTLKDNGASMTELNVYEGTVAIEPHRADGTPTGEVVMVEAGKEIVVWGNAETSGFDLAPAGIDYTMLNNSELQFLSKSTDEGRVLSISREQLDALIKGGTTGATGSGTTVAGAAVKIVPVDIASGAESSGYSESGSGSGSDSSSGTASSTVAPSGSGSSSGSSSTGAMSEAGSSSDTPSTSDAATP